MKIAFIGSGRVGAALAGGLSRAGHEVTLGGDADASESIRRAVARNGNLAVATPKEAVGAASVVFLAVPFAANEEALGAIADEIRGKVLVDCTNPVGPGLTHGLSSARSGAERVQELAPDARVVKAFSIYGYENFESTAYPGYGVKPVMLLCGNDAAAKATVSGLAAELGWEPLDVGGLEQALHLEHMTLLWVRMVRAHGQSPNLVWAALRR